MRSPDLEGTKTRNVKKITFFGLALVFAGSPLLKAQDTPNPARPPDILEQFAVANDGDAIMLPVTIAKMRYQFLLDTGSTFNVFDVSLRPLLGAPRPGEIAVTTNKSVKPELYDAPNAFLGTLSLRTPAPVVCAKLASLTPKCGFRIDGIIGMAFLKNYVIDLDVENGKVAFLKSATVKEGTAFPLSYSNECPQLMINVPGLGLTPFTIDTGEIGFDSGSLNKKDFVTLLANGKIRLLKAAASSYFPFTAPPRTGIVSESWLGERRLENLMFSETGDPNSLGLRFCSRYHAIFDFPNQIVYLRPNQRSSASDLMDRSGIQLIHRNGHVYVNAILNGTPGAKAGIRRSDRILKIESTDTEGARLHSLRLILCSTEREIRLTLQRGEEVFEAIVLLPNLEGNR